MERAMADGSGKSGGKQTVRKGGTMKGALLLLSALASGTAVGVLFVAPGVAPLLAQRADPEAPAGAGMSADAPAAAPASLFTVENVLVNPAGTEGTRFLLMSVALELPGPRELELLQARETEIRDLLIRVVGQKTVPELADVTLREELVDGIRAALRPLLGTDSVGRILFPQFVIQ